MGYKDFASSVSVGMANLSQVTDVVLHWHHCLILYAWGNIVMTT